MKTLFLYSVLLTTFFIAACKGGFDSGSDTDNSDSPAASSKKITKRDLSITKTNAYNDLFLDSAVMEQFMAEKKLPDSISRRVRSFYNARNYQFAWFSSDGLTEQARGFWNLLDYHTTYNKDTALYDKALQRKMDALIAAEDPSFSASNPSTINTELSLTQRFVQYMLSSYEGGYVKRKEMERFIPRKREDALYIADSLLNKKHKDNKYFEDVNEPYKHLKNELAKYYKLAKSGGWPQIDSAQKTYKKGITAPVIALIKKRLQLTGEMPGNDTSQLFNDTLEIGIKNFQQELGYTPSGIITKTLIREMNRPALERVEQILVNMGRMRWMPQTPSGDLIVVNIPEFVLHVYDGKQKAFDMNVVVGKQGHNTTMFTGDLNQVVFAPYWNVPASIVEKEVIPSMQKDPGYLERNHMEITGNDENGLPKVRQLPGPDNSLGRVKFLFPNSFDIYFHDTNAKELFNRDKRAYSHGCIRLSDPTKMAQYVLREQPEWTPERMEAAMDSTMPTSVRVKKPIPVFISYNTAWVDDGGRLNFRDDIYGHDSAMVKKMFVRPF